MQNEQKLFVPIALFLGVGFLMISSLFTVDQATQALVLQFGEARRVHVNPGLKWKLPLIQEVIYLEKRVLDCDLPLIPITTGDQKRLVVDVYVRYRIENPLLFYQSIKPAHEVGAKARLEALVSSSIRNVLGKIQLRKLLSAERASVMKQIEEEVKTQSKPLGLGIVDVRIIRTELPNENREAVFQRMNAELDRFAKENRAKGAEQAQTIRAQADRKCTEITAEATKRSSELRGEGDGEAIRIAAQAFGKDSEFYSFYKTIETYKESFSKDSSIVLSTDSALMRLMTDLNSKTQK